MSATLFGALVAAGTLGVVHAVEPDHVAGISSVTSQYGDSRLSALVGACFSLGHVALVVVWLIGGYLLLGRTEFPPVFDTVGTVGVTLLLGGLGATMAVSGLRSMRHTHEHDHGGEVHEHPHFHFPLMGSDHEHGEPAARADRDHGADRDERGDHARSDGNVRSDGVVPHAHGHGLGAYLKTGVVGALFTLSPPVTMIVFASRLFPDSGGGVVALAVAAYAVSITATMSAIGAGVGAFFGATAASPRLHAAARVFGGVLVAGLAVSLFTGALPALA